MWKLRSIDGMRCVRCDQCQFGMTSVDSAGNVGPACKATGFMTNDEYIAEAVNRQCFGGHDHIQLLSGRAKSCEKYLPRLVAAILRATEQASRGTRRSTENDGTRSTVDNRSRWRLGRLWRSRSCCRSLTMLTVIKSSEARSHVACVFHHIQNKVQRQKHWIAAEP